MKQKKNINIIVGTNNAGKLREIKDLLPKNLIIYSPKKLKLKSPKENGKSFCREDAQTRWSFTTNQLKSAQLHRSPAQLSPAGAHMRIQRSIRTRI